MVIISNISLSVLSKLNQKILMEYIEKQRCKNKINKKNMLNNRIPNLNSRKYQSFFTFSPRPGTLSPTESYA